jgi:hypothetical protein
VGSGRQPRVVFGFTTRQGRIVAIELLADLELPPGAGIDYLLAAPPLSGPAAARVSAVGSRAILAGRNCAWPTGGSVRRRVSDPGRRRLCVMNDKAPEPAVMAQFMTYMSCSELFKLVPTRARLEAEIAQLPTDWVVRICGFLEYVRDSDGPLGGDLQREALGTFVPQPLRKDLLKHHAARGDVFLIEYQLLGIMKFAMLGGSGELPDVISAAAAGVLPTFCRASALCKMRRLLLGLHAQGTKRKSGKAEWPYYACATRRNQGAEVCAQPLFRQSELDEVTWRFLKRWSFLVSPRQSTRRSRPTRGRSARRTAKPDGGTLMTA